MGVCGVFADTPDCCGSTDVLETWLAAVLRIFCHDTAQVVGANLGKSDPTRGCRVAIFVHWRWFLWVDIYIFGKLRVRATIDGSCGPGPGFQAKFCVGGV